MATLLSIPLRLVAALFAVLLWTMAYLQYNDPDPLIWICMYGLLAAVATLACLWRFIRPLAWLGGALALAWALTLSPSVYEMFSNHPLSDLSGGMSAARPYIEQTREALGLLFGSVTMLVLLGASRTRGGG